MFRRIVMPTSSRIGSLNSFLDYVMATGRGRVKEEFFPQKLVPSFLHLCCCLSHDRSIVSSEVISPDCAIYCFLFVSRTFLFPQGHPEAAYVFRLIFPPLLSLLQ